MAPLTAALARAPVPPLARLRVDGNRGLGADGVAAIARALCLLPLTMRALHASDCAAGEAGAERLALYVRSPRFCRLDTLTLDSNAFGAAGVRALAEAVARNQVRPRGSVFQR